jgi:CRP-like cAMP-binding protein
MNRSAELPVFPDEGRAPSQNKLALQEQVAHLSHLPLLANCSKRELRRLAKSTRVEMFEPDQDLITAGEESKRAYVIIAGRAVVRRRGRKIAELGPGDLTGEIGLLLGRERLASVTALTPLEVLVLEQHVLRDAIDEIPGLGWKLLQAVTERMEENAHENGGLESVVFMASLYAQ